MSGVSHLPLPTDEQPVATFDLGGGVQWVVYKVQGVLVFLPGAGVFTVEQLAADVTGGAE